MSDADKHCLITSTTITVAFSLLWWMPVSKQLAYFQCILLLFFPGQVIKLMQVTSGGNFNFANVPWKKINQSERNIAVCKQLFVLAHFRWKTLQCDGDMGCSGGSKGSPTKINTLNLSWTLDYCNFFSPTFTPTRDYSWFHFYCRERRETKNWNHLI